eukprot:COSAG01_NODE_73776_length_236_cov_97.489051_1_plen_41_part_10
MSQRLTGSLLPIHGDESCYWSNLRRGNSTMRYFCVWTVMRT